MTRALPLRVAPLPGECLASWIAAIAIRMRCSWDEVVDAVLPPATRRTARAPTALELSSALTAPERTAVAAATGLNAADLDAMTLAGQHSNVITVNAATRRPQTPWGSIHRVRFCPACMQAHPGRFQLQWLLPWIVCCDVHHCLLADVCPTCHQFQTVSPNWFSPASKPTPHRCRRAVPGAPAVDCGAQLHLGALANLAPAHPALTAQQDLRDLLSADRIAIGVYRCAPVQPWQFLIDVRTLGCHVLRNTSASYLVDVLSAGVPASTTDGWVERLAADKAVLRRPAHRMSMAGSAAAGITAAVTILSHMSPLQAGAYVNALCPIDTPRRPPSRSSCQATHSSAVAAILESAAAQPINPVIRARYRLRTALPCPPSLPPTATHDRIWRAVPTLLWPEWAARLTTATLDWPTARLVYPQLLLVIGASPQTPPDLHNRLRSPMTTAQTLTAIAKLQRTAHGHTVIAALLRLYDHLTALQRPAIDYQRRRELDFTDLLPIHLWRNQLQPFGITLLEPAAIAARGWLIEQIAGVPAPGCTSTTSQRSTWIDHHLTHRTPELTHALEAIAVEFLRRQGIDDEPLRWTPPTALLDGLDLPTDPGHRFDPGVTHRLLAAHLSIPEVAEALHVPVWMVRQHIEQHPPPTPSRHEVAPASHDQTTRPAMPNFGTLRETADLLDICPDALDLDDSTDARKPRPDELADAMFRRYVQNQQQRNDVQ